MKLVKRNLDTKSKSFNQKKVLLVGSLEMLFGKAMQIAEDLQSRSFKIEIKESQNGFSIAVRDKCSPHYYLSEYYSSEQL